MIDHITIRVADPDRSKDFYLAALAPLGFRVHMQFEFPGMGKVYGLGNEMPELWIATASAEHVVPFGMHLAFRAPTREAIHAFHAAALAAGGTDDGGAGPRPAYHPGYYGAFVIDPDGIRLEVVKHMPE